MATVQEDMNLNFTVHQKMVNCENSQSHETHFYKNFMQLPTCLHRLGLTPLGLSRNTMTRDACDAAVDRPACRKEG